MLGWIMASEKDVDAQGPLETAMQRIQEAGSWATFLDLSDLGLGPVMPSDWPGWEALARLLELRSLDLRNNQLTAIPREGWNALGRLHKLRHLTLGVNQVSTMPLDRLVADLWNRFGFGGRTRFGGNKIAEITAEGWEELGRLENLEQLDLSANQIRDIPVEAAGALRRLDCLSKLDLSGNPLPEELLAAASRGKESLVEYLTAAHLRAAHPRTVKLMLLGEPASGKTTLVEALNGNPNPCDPQRPETVGVNVQRIEKKSPADGRPLFLGHLGTASCVATPAGRCLAECDADPNGRRGDSAAGVDTCAS